MKTVTFEMVGRQIELAPTPIAKMAQHIGSMSEINTMSEAGINALAKLVTIGVKRANKDTDITEEWLLDNLDTTNMDAVFGAFITVNGLEAHKAGSGEAKAGQS